MNSIGIRRAVCSAFLILCLHTPLSFAATLDPITPEKRALIQELFTVSQTRKNAQSMLNSRLSLMDEQLKQLLAKDLVTDKRLSVADRKGMQKSIQEMATRMSQRLRETYTKRLNYPQMLEEVSLTYYDKYFSADEIRDLITFYRTPTGQKSVEILPQLSIEIVRDLSNRILPLEQQVIKEVIDEQIRKSMPPPAAPKKSARSKKAVR